MVIFRYNEDSGELTLFAAILTTFFDNSGARSVITQTVNVLFN